jgi:hypothetical protein
MGLRLSSNAGSTLQAESGGRLFFASGRASVAADRHRTGVESPAMSESEDLAKHIRSELLGREPAGFGAHRAANAQGETVERLAISLKEHPREIVETAIAQLVDMEADPWTFLKLVELSKELKPNAAAASLLRRVENPPPESSDRRLFMQGCTCEVLLSLDLDAVMRQRAENLCGPPLFHLSRVRSAVDQRVEAHRPKTGEWLLLAGAMLAAASAVAYVLLAR